MLTTVDGYYDGTQIVLNENVLLTRGQKVMVTILEDKPQKKSIDIDKYRVGKYGISTDAQEYVTELRGNSKADKQKAFNRMEELRKISAQYQLGDLDEERANAVEEKYGKLI